jgi:predicted DCC family thiol-disulfide oxidoreductase YuxK
VILLYDADCGFCTRTALWGARLVPNVSIRAMQDVDLSALGVDPVRAEAEIPYVTTDGGVTYGSEAIACALIDNGGWPSSVGRVLLARRVRPAARTMYRFIARHRHQFPGGTTTCRLDVQGGEDVLH